MTGTAVSPERVAEVFKAIPGVNFPEPVRRFSRLDFGPEEGIATTVPPKVGKPYPCLVPAVDQDGNEVCGVLLPYQTVPLATLTGWNTRHPDSRWRWPDPLDRWGDWRHPGRLDDSVSSDTRGT